MQNIKDSVFALWVNSFNSEGRALRNPIHCRKFTFFNPSFITCWSESDVFILKNKSWQ